MTRIFGFQKFQSLFHQRLFTDNNIFNEINKNEYSIYMNENI